MSFCLHLFACIHIVGQRENQLSSIYFWPGTLKNTPDLRELDCESKQIMNKLGGGENRARKKEALMLPFAAALLKRLISQNSRRQGTVCVVYFRPLAPRVSRCLCVGSEQRALAANAFMEMNVAGGAVRLCDTETCPEVELCHVRLLQLCQGHQKWRAQKCTQPQEEEEDETW